MDWNSPIVIVLLLLLVAVVAVSILPGAIGWVIAAICIIGCVALLLSRRRPRT